LPGVEPSIQVPPDGQPSCGAPARSPATGRLPDRGFHFFADLSDTPLQITGPELAVQPIVRQRLGLSSYRPKARVDERAIT
jgi:hypothetical protein